MRIVFLGLCWGAYLAGPAGFGQTNGSVSLPAQTVTPAFINRLAEEMRTNNAGLGAAQARTNAAHWNVAAVRHWEDPMFSFGGVVAGNRGPMLDQEGDLIYGIDQKLPLFGKPEWSRRVAQAGSEKSRADYEYQFQLMRRDLALALFRTALADRIVDIGQEDLAWLDTQTAAAEQRYRTSDGSLVDVLRMQTEKAKRADQRRTDVADRDREQVNLNRRLNRQLNTPWPALALPALASPVVFSQRLVDLSVRYEPKLKVLQQEIRQAQALAELTRRHRRPDISLGVEGRQYSGDGGLREGMFTVRFNLPWFNAGKYRNDLKRDQASAQAAEREAADYELGVREEAYGLTVRIDAARRQAILYRDDIIPKAQQARAAAQSAWMSNKGSFNDLMETRRLLLEGRLMLSRAITEQYQMLADLVLCCGLADLEALDMIKL